MTKEEIFLIKELIKETVKSVVKETIREEYQSQDVKKDMKEVKLLLAKVLKEGYAPMKKETYGEGVSTDLKSKIREAVGEDFKTVVSRTTSNLSSNIRMSPESAANLSVNGTLPDVDAPIPFIDKSSPLWKNLKEKTT
jgi:hypothetical protein